MEGTTERPEAMLERLVDATNRHDLEALVDCFAEDYENETPVHPSRGFRGRDQVRKNWQQILAFVPDLEAEVLRRAVQGDTVWSEWEMRGRRRDGSAHRMRGIVIFRVREGRAGWARFYLEPVDDAGDTVDDAVRNAVAPAAGGTVILVAGGTGRLGSLLVRRLSGRGLRVRVLTRDPARAQGLEEGRVEVTRGDVRDVASLGQALKGVTTVVSAVHGFVGPGLSPASVDHRGNINLVEAASGVGADFVLVSIVGAAADSPMDLFRAKHAAEVHLRQSGLAWTIVRATAFVETWATIIAQMLRGGGKAIVFGRGDNPINFVSAEDVAALLERAVVDQALRGRAIDLGGSQNVTFTELATLVQKTVGKPGPLRHIPRPLLQVMSLVLRVVKPGLARQVQAALVLDSHDMTFDDRAIREAFPDLPNSGLATAVERCLGDRGSATA